MNSGGEQWTADINLPEAEEFYKIDITAFDQSTSGHFSVPNTTRFTTAGPIKVLIEYSAYKNFNILSKTIYKRKVQSKNTIITN